MWGCYIYAANIPPPLACVSLETLMENRAELFVHVPPPGRPIPIHVAPFLMDDNIPREDKIDKALLWLQLHNAGGPSGMRYKYLRLWLRAEMQEEDPYP